MPSRTLYTEATDSMGNTVVEGDYVLAYIRDYFMTPGAHNSGTARRMVRGTITGFAGENKVRMVVEGFSAWDSTKSYVGSHYVTLIAPKNMADSYKEAFAHYAEGDD